MQLYSVNPLQVNYLAPGAMQPGPAILTVTSSDGTATTGMLLVAPVMPGLYSADANGKGPAAAIAVCAGICAGYPSVDGVFYQYT